jgi:hypothetical protein
MTLASPWYSSSSSLFWLTVALLVIAIVTLIVIWRSSVLRRRLMCSIISRTRMLSAPKPIKDDLTISYRDKKVDDPYVANIEISNVGRAPILGEDYTQSRSLKFELAAPIVTVLSVWHKPASAPRPSITSEGNIFELQPELLVRGETIRTSLLTEGQPGDVRVFFNPFGAVKVLARDREAWEKKRLKRLQYTAVTLATVAVGLIVALLITLISSNKSLSAVISEARYAACQSVELQAEATETSIGTALLDVQLRPQRTSSPPPQVIPGSRYGLYVDTFDGQISLFSYDVDEASGLGISLSQSSAESAIFNSAYVTLGRISKGNSNEQRYNDYLAVLNDVGNSIKMLGKIKKQCSAVAPYIGSLVRPQRRFFLPFRLFLRVTIL